jgi:hypothetical protein
LGRSFASTVCLPSIVGTVDDGNLVYVFIPIAFKVEWFEEWERRAPLTH